MSAILRSSDHEGEIERDDALLAQKFRHIAFGDFLREAFDNGGLTNTCFAQQHRIVLSATAKNLNNAFDLVLATDDRVHVALASDFGEITTECLERGCFDFTFLFRATGSRRFLRIFSSRLFFLCCEIRIQLLQDFLARLLDVNFKILENASSYTVAFTEQAEKNVFRADIGMIECLGFL